MLISIFFDSFMSDILGRKFKYFIFKENDIDLKLALTFCEYVNEHFVNTFVNI